MIIYMCAKYFQHTLFQSSSAIGYNSVIALILVNTVPSWEGRELVSIPTRDNIYQYQRFVNG